MLLKTHLAFSFALYYLAISNHLIKNNITFLIGIIAGTLIVDIDSPKSKIGRIFIFKPAQFLFVKHRGAIHSIFFAFVFSFLLYPLSNQLGASFFVGYVSHLFLDSLTKRGIMLAWPITTKRFGLILKSGGLFEIVFFYFLLVFDVIAFGVLIFH